MFKEICLILAIVLLFMGSDELASVTSLGTNYVIVESKWKVYIENGYHDVELIRKEKRRKPKS